MLFDDERQPGGFPRITSPIARRAVEPALARLNAALDELDHVPDDQQPPDFADLVKDLRDMRAVLIARADEWDARA